MFGYAHVEKYEALPYLQFIRSLKEINSLLDYSYKEHMDQKCSFDDSQYFSLLCFINSHVEEYQYIDQVVKMTSVQPLNGEKKETALCS